MTRSQLVTLFIMVALVCSAGSYLANTMQRRSSVRETQQTSAKTCIALRNVLLTFKTQEQKAGANTTRLLAYDQSLNLVRDC